MVARVLATETRMGRLSSVRRLSEITGLPMNVVARCMIALKRYQMAKEVNPPKFGGQGYERWYRATSFCTSRF